MKQFCENAIQILNSTKPNFWAQTFFELKIEFFNRFQNGLICSTWHGINWFENVLSALDGNDLGEPKGEYKNNFDKLIKSGLIKIYVKEFNSKSTSGGTFWEGANENSSNYLKQILGHNINYFYNFDKIQKITRKLGFELIVIN